MTSSAPSGPAGPVLSQETQDFLAALASPTRQAILALFARGAELSVGEVAEQAGLGQSTASEQLKALRRAGTVLSRRDGKTVLYRADREGMTRVLADLQDYLRTCC
ncbi:MULTISPECIES: ArsR/SmtB family transcription factor [Isoptericola]|uniref:ArsR/SmtB family transcription factor n=1 Tax=Isoptericola TaxID=254250 RepID=UPI00383A21EB